MTEQPKNIYNKSDRCIGVLLGGCCGDVLGSQTENKTKGTISNQYPNGVIDMPKNKKYTDDTEMTLVLARHLALRKDVYMTELHNEYGQELSNKGYSQKTREILTYFKNNPSPSFMTIGKANTNGAVMRIAPIGLLSINSEQTFRMVQNAVFYTHGDSMDAVYAGFLHARLINALVNNRFNSKKEYIYYILGHSKRHLSLWKSVNIVQLNLQSDILQDITLQLYGTSNTFQIQAIEALCCALYTFFYFYDKPEKALMHAAAMGGDTDTIAKLVGDLCGARHGTSWIPERWLGVEGEEELTKLGVDLSRL